MQIVCQACELNLYDLKNSQEKNAHGHRSPVTNCNFPQLMLLFSEHTDLIATNVYTNSIHWKFVPPFSLCIQTMMLLLMLNNTPSFIAIARASVYSGPD